MPTPASGRGSLPALRRPPQSTSPPTTLPPLAVPATLPAGPPQSISPPTCAHCGAAFAKPTAKFCARCGTKKAGATSPTAGGGRPRKGRDGEGGGPPLSDTQAPARRSSASGTIPFTEGVPSAAGRAVGGGVTLHKGAPPATAPPPPPLSSPAVGEEGGAVREAAAGPTLTSSPTHRDAAVSLGTVREREGEEREGPPSRGARSSTTRATVVAADVGPATAARAARGSTRSSADAPGGAVKSEGTPTPSNSGTPATMTMSGGGTLGSLATLEVPPEEEAKYTAWSTLGPEGLTPDMLQTHNATSDLTGWRKGSLIGRGTYGSVYLGLLHDGSFYAVKCVEIGGKHAADMTFNVRELVSLSREINMMQRLRHRNLCTFKGVLYEADTTSICMFMEYVGGGSLSSIVKRFKPLPAPVVRRWTRQLLSGLLYLHSQHIIHRDIKGDNVLIDTGAAPESEAQVKLVDFGAARRLADAVSQSRTTIGTPYWMAPEVVDVTGDGRGYSFKADVWSVGCTVAEMLTGRPPWPARSSAPAVIMMVASAEGMPTEVPKEEATPGCYDFMLKCFIRDPEQRPTVEELLQHPWILGEME